ncbi:major facilitator superfamily domain-containing protein [Penicillium macrosclerotiorum]|uniref:major facilitator superfamily domain-containing protein n=1 Tax=Penicillium macrosclerotiorum TaxID=303699 RepID=UPI0025485E04|nr:major facilitator superfamily domain-containing protein [Penicillium macrosclerotiorum]KAJ5669021.1 major facilitator superfamily domain-containing protein [Penicillium macrosclerotiorum]
MLCVYQLVPKTHFAAYSGMVSVTIALATIAGPIVGGALGKDTAWRWLFYMNLPPGCIAMILAAISMPPHFSRRFTGLDLSTKSGMQFMWNIDLPGMFFLLGGSLMLVTVIDETNSHFSWSSPTAIILVIMSVIFWAGFFVWEIRISDPEFQIRPVFPKTFFSNLPLIGIFLTSFLVGVPYNSVIVYLPQRFQVIMGDSALMAGIRLLGYSGVTAFSSTFAIGISTKLKVPFLPILIVSAVINLAGIVLLATLPTSAVFPPSGYGYEVLAGCGMGIAYGISVFSVPYLLDLKDLQEASGIVVQMRYLGSSVGVSISSNIFNGRLKSGVSSFLSKDAYERLLHNVESLSDLTRTDQARVQENFAKSYKIQFQVLIGFAIAQLAVAFLLLKRGKQTRPLDLASKGMTASHNGGTAGNKQHINNNPR